MTTLIEPLFSEDRLRRRVRELAAALDQRYAGTRPLMVCVLKGAMPFFVDLTRQMQLSVDFDYVAVSSYEGGLESTGRVRFVADLSAPVQGRDVVLVEDIVDTGRTMRHLLDVLGIRGARSLEIATLLDKPSRRVVDLEPAWVGFEIPDKFVVGYGMDYDEKYRDLPYVGVLRTP